VELIEKHGSGAGTARRRLAPIACLALALGGLGVTSALAAQGDTRLISRQSQSDGGDGAAARSFTASLSKHGRFTAFTTEATNLGGTLQTAPGETNVYVYDSRERVVELASRQSESKGGLGANGDSRVNAISGNGRFVVFRTEATNLGGPINATDNLYVYDRRRERVELVSRRSKSKGGKGANSNADNPSISQNGRYVAYNTFATNLGGPTAGNGEANVYVYDRERKRTTLASRRSQAANGKGGNASSFDAQIAAEAPVVAFVSQASNLGGAINPGVSEHVYVHNWKARKTQLVSRRSQSQNGKGANGDGSQPDISAGGRYVAFATDATNLGGPTQTTIGEHNAYRYDRKARRTLLVSRRSRSKDGKGADASSSDVAISDSGRYLAYHTPATNLGGPIDALFNVYAFDAERGRTSLVSRESGGGPGGDDDSFEPGVSGSGRFVAFATNADNLGGPVFTGGIPDPSNIYRFDLLGP
jgi:hypothetical protein